MRDALARPVPVASMSTAAEQSTPRLHAFEAWGVAIEYAVVDRDRGDPLPVSDSILRDENDVVAAEVDAGMLTWSSMPALHSLGLGTSRPVPTLLRLEESFEEDARTVDSLLAEQGATLLPCGMHPWMDPAGVAWWPHRGAETRRALDAIFDCRTHGWVNSYAVQLEVPYASSTELRNAFAALRFLLPIVPALGAGSPVVEGHRARALDSRIVFESERSRVVPEMVGLYVPDPVTDELQYRRDVLTPIDQALRTRDPVGRLHGVALDGRALVIDLERHVLRLRIVDSQESASATLAILRAVAAVAGAIARGRLGDVERLAHHPTEALVRVLRVTTRDAEQALVDPEYAAQLGVRAPGLTASELWWDLLWRHPPDGGVDAPLRTILELGPLARRMLRWLGPDPWERPRLERLAIELRRCLFTDRQLAG